MKECPAIIAALPREIKGLVGGWRAHKDGKVVVYTSDFAVAACAGMGASRVALAVQAAMAMRPVTALLSVGLAGGCDPKVRVGDVVCAGVVVDTLSGERFSSSPEFTQVLATGSAIASVREKRRLFESYGASAVDMEAATVARIALGHKLPFRAIKAISDEAGFELEELARFATKDGQFREAAFAAYAIARPRMWSKLIELGRNGKLAVDALTVELGRQIDWYRQKD
jgi:adenosylhomocysteine nucleosidase